MSLVPSWLRRRRPSCCQEEPEKPQQKSNREELEAARLESLRMEMRIRALEYEQSLYRKQKRIHIPRSHDPA